MSERAFPSPKIEIPGGSVIGPFAGMTLRDYFAAQAMQAEIQADGGIMRTSEGMLADARQAYLMADAMLAAREEEPEDQK